MKAKPTVKLELLFEDAALSVCRRKNLVLVFWSGTFGLAQVEGFRAQCRKLSTKGSKVALVHLVSTAVRPPDSGVRNELSSVLQESAAIAETITFAILAEGAAGSIVRWVLSKIFAAARPPVPPSVVGTVKEAVLPHLTGEDAATTSALLAEIERRATPTESSDD